MGEAIVKLRTLVWCRPKALRCLRSESGSFGQSFDVGLCASCCGDDMCPGIRFGSLGVSAVESFGRWLLLRKSVLRRVFCFDKEEGVFALMLVVLVQDTLG
ncbi:hypothetical protein L3X38_017798 [Prunus dulcis]|uniref:Uncharacterized protein n=1 Tax=Prunus dulcis TaxID=3755 RepID=A0AAD4Z9H5_PRUDU|nr:hypothetical protein L3X38_017798 [Prunus dulcis]